MGCMARVITLWVGGAADGSSAHFESLPAEPEAMCAGERVRTFGSEQSDMVGGLGKVGGQLCACSAFGCSPNVFGLDLTV